MATNTFFKASWSARVDLTVVIATGYMVPAVISLLVVLSNGLKGQTFRNSLINAYRREHWPFQ